MCKLYYLVTGFCVLLFCANPANNKSTPATGTVTDIDGIVYKTVTIGTQVWMAENLKTTRLNDGTAIALVTDDSAWDSLTTPGRCWNYNDSTSNKKTYGALYNWYVVNSGKLAPAGWHVPTDSEWSIIITYAGGDSMAAGKLKEVGTMHWFPPNTGATNEFGFSALPGGYRDGYGIFIGPGNYGYWWSSTPSTASGVTDSWGPNMYWNTVNVYDRLQDMNFGLSVRCVKN